MTDKKISELDVITGSNTAATDVFVVVDTSTGQTKKITRQELNNAIERDVLDSIDIDTIQGDFAVNGSMTITGTVDGRDVAADGTKLDGIEASATADQTASEIKTAYESNADTNEFSDAEQTKLAGVEANATADQTAAQIKTAYESNADTNEFSDAEQTKLAGIEAAADVTDATNVTAAGAAMLTGATFTGSITATEATFSGNTSVKLPAGTDAQRPTGVNGMLRYNSDDNQFEGYADGAWGAIAGGGGETSLLEYSYTATAGQTTFSGSDDNSATLAYTAANLIVTLNGIVLENGADYTASNGTSIVLAVAAALNDELNIIAFSSFTVSDTVPASTGGTFSGNVSVTGDLTVDTDTLVVNSTNNRVGIGTTSPSNLLDVEGASGSISSMRVANPDVGLKLSAYTNSFAEIRVETNHPLVFKTNGNNERLRIDSSGNLQHLLKPAYFARAWVNFKGTGTVSIRESNNVSSVTDLGTGDYRVNFYTAMTDANYSIHFGGSPQNGRFLVNWAGVINNGSTAVVNSTSNCRIAMIDGGSGSRADSTNNYVSIFR